MTEQQLREWYARFAKELRENASIDVTCVEDLGRVKNFPIREWADKNDPEIYEKVLIGEPTYAFMPHDGTNCLVTPPSGVDYKEFKQWVRENLQTEISINHIRNLYDMSRAGTLMVYAPGVGANGMQQVYTNENGKITTSQPIDNYTTREIKEQMLRKEIGNWAGLPIFVEEPDPTAYELPAKPVGPKKPENMDPGFWSWLGYILGMDTDYAKMQRYYDEQTDYREQLEKWEELVNSGKGLEYRVACHQKESFERAMEEYRSKPEAILQGIASGYQDYVFERTNVEDEKKHYSREKLYRHLMNEEDKDLKQEHFKTPFGKLNKGLEDTIAQRNAIGKRTVKSVNLLLSIDAGPDAHEEWIWGKEVYKFNDYKPEKGDDAHRMPKYPFGDPRENLHHYNTWKKEINALSGVGGFCALADPAITGDNFTDVVSALFTVGIPNSQDKLKYLSPARDKGIAAVKAYTAGDSEQLATLLSNGLRRLNSEALGAMDMRDEHAINIRCLVDHAMKILEGKPELMERINLSELEKKQIAEHRAVYQMIYKGREARVALMEHATYKRQLTPEELKQAAADILFADVVTNTLDNGGKMDLSDSASVTEAKQKLAADRGVDKITIMDREELGHLNLSMVNFIKAFPVNNESVAHQQQASRQLAGPEANNNELKAPEIKQPNIM